MTDEIEFYYDIISPYSFLAHKRILKIEKEKKITFRYKPILLGGLHNLLNITAPAFVQSKSKYLIDDCNMVAKKYNINFKFNDKFPINSLSIMRGVLVVEKNKLKNYVNNFFDAYWSYNKDLSKENEIINVLEKLEIEKEIFFSKIKDQSIKDKLKKFTMEACDKKIFGAPSFIVNNKIFWGQDRLDYALDEFRKT